jgi:lipid II:glycine glycyltransferase (peptidoglycan interpeptide bridge formation enzyme)
LEQTRQVTVDYTLLPFSEIPRQDWDAACEQSPGSWFTHTSGWIEYTASMRLQEKSENLSFAVTDGRRLMALVPLVKENHQGRKHISYAGFNTPYPAFLGSLGEAERKALEKFTFEKIASLSDVDYWCFYVSALTDEVLNHSLNVNPLPKHGYQDTTISTNILLLNTEEDALYRSFRKGCKSDIKTAQKRGCKVFIVDKTNYQAKYFDSYRAIHFEAAGRQTRSDESWEKQRCWLQEGSSLLAVEEKDGQTVSAAFVNTYKNRAYYQSCATLPSFEREVGIGHVMQWEIIRHLKKNAFTHYEIGWNYYPNISQEVADPNLLGISRFKGGFGADVYPLFRGERFKTMEYMKSVHAQRLAAYESLAEETLLFSLGAKREEAAVK